MQKKKKTKKVKFLLSPEKAVNTRTQEEYNALVKFLLKNGLKWTKGTKEFSPLQWEVYYREETCIRFVTGQYGYGVFRFVISRKSQLGKEYRILSFEDFLYSQGFRHRIIIAPRITKKKLANRRAKKAKKK
jgi:hypothetical protein